MALQYLRELLDSLCFNKRCRGDEELAEIFGRLPDCLVIDILSRLPTDSLVRFRRDCRDLRVLIASQYFTTLHLSRARPMPLLQKITFDTKMRSKQFYMNIDNLNMEYWLGTLYFRRNKQLGKHPPRFVCSCQGVVLFAYNPTTYYVLNPITKEEVIVQHTHQPGYLCALYFCPLTREFKLVYVQVRDSWCQYLVYVFKTRTWRKIHSPSTFNFYPCDASPAVVNGALHWIMCTDLEKKDVPPCANGIMVFKMDTEELSAMPHPGSVCNSKKVHHMMTLLVKENCLSFCHLLRFPKFEMDIWILEDYETWAWNKRYKLNLFAYTYPSHAYVPQIFSDIKCWAKPMYIQDGELVLCLWGEGVYFFDLDHNTVKEFSLPRAMTPLGTYTKSLLPIA